MYAKLYILVLIVQFPLNPFDLGAAGGGDVFIYSQESTDMKVPAQLTWYTGARPVDLG